MANKRPKKSLGQNFLTSKTIAEGVVSSACLVSGEVVLEIGPGKGFLTKELLKTGARVVAIEKDKELVFFLQSEFAEELKTGKLKVVEGDVREFFSFSKRNSSRLPKSGQGALEEFLSSKTYKLVANIPYYLTSHLTTSFLKLSNPPTIMVLMIQKEVAERIVSKDGKENLLSLSVKYYGEPKIERLVKAGSFFPKPKVDSAIISIKNIHIGKPKEEKNFFNFVEKGFSQKRKKLLSVLGQYYDKKILAQAWRKCSLQENIRPEGLSLKDWKSLTDFIPIE